MRILRDILIEQLSDTILLYHGTSSNHINKIRSNNTIDLFLTTSKDAATYYAAKAGEDYFLTKEIEFEQKQGINPYEYYEEEIDKYGETVLFKLFYPKNAYPIVITFKTPKYIVKNIETYIGYKGKNMEISTKYITNIEKINWDDLNY